MLPDGTRNFAVEVKYYLSCYRAWSDANSAITSLGEQRISITHWKVQWAGICAVMKASVHLMKMDSKRCFSTELRDVLKARYDHLGQTKLDHPIFWQFIDRERHNILKEYQFSAYEAIIQNPDNDGKDLPTLLSSMMADKELRIQGGPYDGRPALDVAKEASAWLLNYIEDTIRLAGFEPDERIQSDGFIGWRRVPKPDPNAPKWWQTITDEADESSPSDAALLPAASPKTRKKKPAT